MTVFIFIAVLVVLIVGHEMGHFFAAKWMKMRVLEFGVGFPPKIFGKRFKKDGTEYTLNWIPFGGFVRILGEDPKDAEDPDAFTKKSPLAQAFVLFAGPFANIVLALVLSSVAFMIGAPTIVDSLEGNEQVHDTRVLIGVVLPDSPAGNAGIEVGDEVVSFTVDGTVQKVINSEHISEAVLQSLDPVTLVVKRDGRELPFEVVAVSGLVEEEPERRAIGISTALVGTVSYGPFEAVARAFTRTIDNLIFITISLVGLLASAVTLSADVSQVAGPIGIAGLTGQAAAFGFGSLLSFAALLSINLGIINLFPFPALDGGRLLFLGIESISRRKIPSGVAASINTVGFGLLILLMIAVTVGDIGRIFNM